MIIDFRVRPPFRGFEKLSLFGEKKAFQLYPFNTPNTHPIPSALDHSMPEFLAEMEAAGITKGVILPRNAPNSWGGVSNDVVMAGVNEYRDKFIGYGSVDMSGGIRTAVEEVERCVTKLGCRGIVVEPGFCKPPLRADAPQMYPVYDRCAQLGVPVVLTLSLISGPDLSYARPETVQRAAHDFPDLQFIIAHAAYPFVMDAISVCCVTENVWLLPDLYMHVESVPDRELYARALAFTQGQRILFGSAYPFRDMQQSVDDVKSFNLPENLYKDLMYRNAVKLLDL